MNAFNTWRKQHFLLLDVGLVTVIVAAAAVLAHTIIRTDQQVSLLNGIRTTLYGTASAACGALLGFTITIATITEAVMQSPQWEEFRKSLAYNQVQDIYFNTIRWLGLSTLMFLVFLVLDTDEHPQLALEIISAWLVGVLAVRMWRSIDALERLLKWNSLKRNTAAR